MVEENLAVGQHQTVGLLLICFGGAALTAATAARLQQIDTGFLTATDTILIALIMMTVGVTLRRWQPE
jgi:hypothetical protein